ncbi:hypothetical protein [Thauera linaloolentis]|uniref:Uncharacterized protein n=1 Tax=Thauera linaloolentis (strain DSM 12138 / JCM 21573 / CCUG 41526 / CIP 105981 / IAM 15112 / NBRC 102519 / 47Lol) TaxID=1123367 RepID=N6Z6X2_THAL4|nr:hypothetical protein [Thauera linaloolentis]ENO87894.1 hypothetical protein C666_10005 [Thauera linaloolentis 47Lol = DSM 12138]MCM8567572.1 hypothetical protein [Thauera linaloolentis]
MKFSKLAAIAALALSGAAFAAEGHDHDHPHEHEAMHGGVLAEARGLDLELVATHERIQLHVRDHGAPVDVSNASAKLTLLSAGGKQEVELKPAGDRLEAAGAFGVGAGTKLVAVLNLPGRPAATARFSLP